jgi:hypothetical protein
MRLAKRAIEWAKVSVPAMLAVAALGACAAKPREMPLRTDRVEEGAGTLESVRRQLEGTWDLQSFETYPAPGKTVTQKARAVLTYDAYGNMTIDGRLEQAGDASPAAASRAAEFLSYKGRIVIDVASQQLRVVGAEGDTAKLPAEASTNLARKYAFQGDVLTLSMVDPKGQTTARTTWKKRAG